MPRKKLIYTHEFPYHVMARSNNREWFYLSKSLVWEIFVSEIIRITTKYSTLIHAFVLMDNHYHMLITCDEKYNLGIVMREFQQSISRKINSKSGRSNHVFGGPYKAALIISENYYMQVFKYILRNPVEARIAKNVSDYEYSSISSKNNLPISTPYSGINSLIPKKEMNTWLEQKEEQEIIDSIKLGLRRTVFKPTRKRMGDA